MSAPSVAPKRPRRIRTVITAPLPHDAGAHSAAMHTANQLILDAHLKRLVDRQRHAIARVNDTALVIYRSWFDGVRKAPSHEVEEYWWFQPPSVAGAPPIMHLGSERAIPMGTSHWYYRFRPDPVARLIKLDWSEINTATVAAIFDDWQSESTLKQIPSLASCMGECAPRRRAVRGDPDPITLHVWNLRQLMQDHIRLHCQATDAWKLPFEARGMLAEIPPLRLTARDIFPMSEHEALVLQRRPNFAALLYRDFLLQHSAEPEREPHPPSEIRPEEVPVAVAASERPATSHRRSSVVVQPLRPLPRSVRSLTPDADASQESDEAEDDDDDATMAM